jgi:hypothetical protein
MRTLIFLAMALAIALPLSSASSQSAAPGNSAFISFRPACYEATPDCSGSGVFSGSWTGEDIATAILNQASNDLGGTWGITRLLIYQVSGSRTGRVEFSDLGCDVPGPATTVSATSQGMWLASFSLEPCASGGPPPLPGMCNGRTDANILLFAFARPRAGVAPTYFLSLFTDGDGDPTGLLRVFGRGVADITVKDWCRLWLHIPGQAPGGDCEEEPPDEGDLNAHAVGIGSANGEEVLVRTDVRRTEEGTFFRVRFRSLEHEHEEVTTSAHEDDGCTDDSWTRIPAEGWAPLDILKAHERR